MILQFKTWFMEHLTTVLCVFCD